ARPSAYRRWPEMAGSCALKWASCRLTWRAARGDLYCSSSATSVILSGVTAELIFVRHGESTFNRDRRWQGQSQDALLSDLGWRQADCAAAALKDNGVVALFSSDLTRAMQTAAAIAVVTGLPIYPDRRLREIDAGRWTNRLSDE